MEKWLFFSFHTLLVLHFANYWPKPVPRQGCFNGLFHRFPCCFKQATQLRALNLLLMCLMMFTGGIPLFLIDPPQLAKG